MAPTLKVNSYDLSDYVLWGDRNHDFGQPLSPQFGGNTAFNDGQPWVRTSAANREWFFPLLLTGTTDAIHALVRTINSNLAQGATVEFKPQGATLSSYFDLEEGITEPHWDLYEDTAGALRCGLRLSTRPYAHTGTTRLVASVSAASYTPSAGPITFSIPSGVVGDTSALANVAVSRTTASTSTSNVAEVWAYGLHSSPSFTPVRLPSTVLSGLGSVIGASGAVGSQYRGLPSSAAVAITDYLAPSGAMYGRHRALLIYRVNCIPASAISIYGYMDYGNNQTANFTGGSHVPTVTGSNGAWQVADLGEVTIPNQPSGPLPNPATWSANIRVGGHAGISSVVGGFPVDVNALVYVPLDISAGFAVKSAAGGGGPGVITTDVTEFRSTPSVQLVRRNASMTVQTNLDGRYTQPAVPPTPTGPITGVALYGGLTSFIGNTITGVQVEVREKFQYLR
jgi:hypothetical protein